VPAEGLRVRGLKAGAQEEAKETRVGPTHQQLIKRLHTTRHLWSRVVGVLPHGEHKHLIASVNDKLMSSSLATGVVDFRELVADLMLCGQASVILSGKPSW
jgi:hypothetical protein